MTDGIIQQVINKQINTHKQFAIDNTDIVIGQINQEVILMLERLEQELIEKIKQNINKGFRCSCIDTDEIIQLLIGDNQK